MHFALRGFGSIGEGMLPLIPMYYYDRSLARHTIIHDISLLNQVDTVNPF